MKRWAGSLLVLSAVGCSPGESSEDSAEVEGPLEEQFSFVVLADPHISGLVEHEERLTLAVEWINSEATSRGIELVLVVGDIGWSEEKGFFEELRVQVMLPTRRRSSRGCSVAIGTRCAK